MAGIELPEHIRAMLQPEFYTHPTRDIQLLQTHISWVILTGDFVYKVKKPVNFGFLDFTGLDRRKYFCEQELILNRRLAPELYLEVLPICQGNGTYRLGESGEIVDYCLKLVQFAQDDLLDRRLEADRFEPAWMDRLAQDIATFHAVAETGPRIRKFGDVSFIRAHIEANYDVASQHLGKVISRNQLKDLQKHSERILAQKDLFRKRQNEGFIRACHGDLHLKNIALFNNKPCVFDCIEFNDEFRMIDTMNDVAFLLMDCDARGRPDLGYRFLSRYLEHTGDYPGLSLLPLYLSYRACVRGKVACLLASDPGLDAQGRRHQLDEAARYFTLAHGYTQPAPPHLFVVGGLSGSGKSHLALLGCGKVPAIWIRSDATRKRLAKTFPDLPLYGHEMSAKTYHAMFAAAELGLKAGFSVIMDATFLRPQDRQEARNIARQAGTDCHILWLDLDASVLKERIRNRTAAGRDISDADLSVLEKQLANYQRPGESDIHFLTDSSHWPDIN